MQLKGAASNLVALLFVTSSTVSHADPLVEADARTSVYQDTDQTTIVTTIVQAKVSPIEQLSFSGHYLADVVSSASVDVVSAATGRWDETRHEGKGSVGYHDSDRSVAGTYIYSVENDWRSHTGVLSFSHDLLDHQLTLGASGSFGYNEVGRADDQNFDERLLTGSASVEAGVIASKHDLLTFTYSFLYNTGFQSSPYRFVRFTGPLEGADLSAPEGVPERRSRHAVGAKWNRHLIKQSYLRTSARAYVDSWGVASGTVGAEFVQSIIHVFDLGVFARAYAQKSASFYEQHYDGARTFMTSDRELATFVDAFGGIRFGFEVKDVGPFYSVRGDLKGTGFLFHFFDFSALTDRYGGMGELGLGASI